MPSPPDLTLLRAFTVTAEEATVGRAAARLHITQSPLSRQLQRLEADLGFALFHRVRKRLILTAEGRQFLPQARALLEQADRLAAAATRLKRGDDLPLTVGYVQAALHSGLLPDALRQWQTLTGGSGAVRLRLLRSHEQATALERGELDLGLVHSLPDGPGFAHRLLGTDPIRLALPAGHPGALPAVPVAADLDGQPWIALDRALNPAFRRQFIDACRDWGFRPDIRYETADVPTALSLVAAGLGCALVHAGATRWGVPDGVVLRPLPGFPITLTTYALWRQDTPSAAAARLLALLPDPGGPLPAHGGAQP
ncbi:LysR family transcriptional regulator [Novispirillum itersonii]|uniref:LysR family transcriptional regulator n=1 Tax=Novispirillum itersonii TaxID=189 RepID=UPI000373FCFD|nr:LysR family transcriptional regulator [Novispirillum itersonii]